MRVHFADTDAGGVMHHASYIRFLEAARTEWLAALGFAQRDLVDRGRVLFAISRIEIDYRHPARLDDHVDIRTSVESLGRASVNVLQSMWCEGRELVEARVRVVSVSVDRFRPTPLPASLVAALRASDTAACPAAVAAMAQQQQ